MSATLPPGWAWVRVGDLVAVPSDLTDGPFGSNLKTDHYRDLGPRVIRLQNIGDGRFLDDEAHISIPHFTRLRKHEAIPGDVVVAMLGSDLPRACLVPPSLGPAIVKADCVRLRPDDRIIDGRYAVAALNSPAVRLQAERLVHGVGRPRLGLKWFRDLRVPLAPVAEQLRLVDTIDSYLSRLDAAVASLEAAQRKLSASRASVLKAAVEGRLVPTEAELARKEGRSYEPADVLLERILKERRRRWEEAELAKMKAAGKTPKEDRWKAKYEEPDQADIRRLPTLPEGWCWSTLGQLIVEPLANGKSVPDGPGFPVLRLTSIRAGRVDLQQRKIGNWGKIDHRPFVLKCGDFLIVRGNGSIHLVGRAGLVGDDADDVAYPDTLIRARVSSDAIFPELLAYIWDAPPVRGHIESRAKTTAGIHKVNQTDLAQTPVPLAPLAEQRRILEEVDRLLSVATATTTEAEHVWARVSRLRQAILAWAFEGRLVDQDPNDESADVLLARIRAERATVAPAAPRRSRSRKLKAAS